MARVLRCYMLDLVPGRYDEIVTAACNKLKLKPRAVARLVCFMHRGSAHKKANNGRCIA